MRVSDWLTLACVALVIAAVVLGRRKGKALQAAALAAAFQRGEASALAAATASVAVHVSQQQGGSISTADDTAALSPAELRLILALRDSARTIDSAGLGGVLDGVHRGQDALGDPAVAVVHPLRARGLAAGAAHPVSYDDAR